MALEGDGVRSGSLRKNPVMRVEHDGVYAAVASQGGAPEHPQWYQNFLADPVWERAVEAYPPYAEYQQKTDRRIPVFLLERR